MVDKGSLKLFLLSYADNIISFSEIEKGLQNGITILNAYCYRWNLHVNISKTKMVCYI